MTLQVDVSWAQKQEHFLHCSSTRIKDAGIAIHHSRGRILFYNAGSGNGLEGSDGKDVCTKFMKKESQIIKKGLAAVQT